MKGHSSRREGNVWAPTQLFRSLHSLVARGLLSPLSEVFPFSATYPYVSFSFRPYTSHVSCILSSSASKRTAPSRSHKPYHLKFHWPANKQIAKGQILSPGQWAVIMVGSGKGQEVQRWPKVKKCARPLLSAKNTSEQASESWELAYLLNPLVSPTKHMQNGTHHINLKPRDFQCLHSTRPSSSFRFFKHVTLGFSLIHKYPCHIIKWLSTVLYPSFSLYTI